MELPANWVFLFPQIPKKASSYFTAPLYGGPFSQCILSNISSRIAWALEGAQLIKFAWTSAVLVFEDCVDWLFCHPIAEILGLLVLVGRTVSFHFAYQNVETLVITF
jgi:hypothetical protein